MALALAAAGADVVAALFAACVARLIVIGLAIWIDQIGIVIVIARVIAALLAIMALRGLVILPAIGVLSISILLLARHMRRAA